MRDFALFVNVSYATEGYTFKIHQRVSNVDTLVRVYPKFANFETHHGTNGCLCQEIVSKFETCTTHHKNSYFWIYDLTCSSMKLSKHNCKQLLTRKYIIDKGLEWRFTIGQHHIKSSSCLVMFQDSGSALKEWINKKSFQAVQ